MVYQRKKPIEILTQKEIMLIFNWIGKYPAWTRFRDQTMFILMWRSGLRSQEVCDLRIGDIDLDQSIVTIRSGKGGKPRVAAMDEKTCYILTLWLKQRELIPSETDWLFVTARDRKVTTNHLRNLFIKARKATGIRKRVHPHTLRHSHAVEMKREGTPVEVISKQLGHSSSSVTAVYLDHVTTEDLVQATKHRDW